jgi:predicted SAM-dependent methyltransferase
LLEGFQHIDLADEPHIDHQHRIDQLPMIESESCELVYVSHAFEYFDRKDAPRVLAEWRRVLVPGGILRLAVPNFASLVQIYEQTGSLDRVIGPLFGRWIIPGTDQIVFHKTVYDEASLTSILEQSGFMHIRHWDWRRVFQGDHEGFDDYSQAYFPHMEKEEGLLVSLNLEAVRT